MLEIEPVMERPYLPGLPITSTLLQMGTEPTTNSPSLSLSDIGTLGTNTTTAVTMSNLIFGFDYRLLMTGRDRAGNESPVSGVVTVFLDGFVVTQGVQEVNAANLFNTNALQIGWTAATDGNGKVTKDYDLIYVDRFFGFYESTTNEWELVDTVHSNWYADEGSGSRSAPLLLGETMRFYRASSKDRWKMDRQPRVASEEIYVMKNINLVEGQNWIALPGIPDDSRPGFVLGHKLPGGSLPANSTRLSWYDRDNQGTATQQIYLVASGGSNSWKYAFPSGGSSAESMDIPLEQGFVLELPDGSGSDSFPFIGRIPTNNMTQELKSGYNLVNVGIPRKLKVSELNLEESGFRSGTFPGPGGGGDMLWIWNRENQIVMSGSIIWLSDGTLPAASPAGWYYINFNLTTSKYKAVPEHYYPFKPDDGMVIFRPEAPSSMIFTNKVPYLAPTVFVTP